MTQRKQAEDAIDLLPVFFRHFFVTRQRNGMVRGCRSVAAKQTDKSKFEHICAKLVATNPHAARHFERQKTKNKEKIQKNLDKWKNICYNSDLIRVPERPSPYRAKKENGTVESP